MTDKFYIVVISELYDMKWQEKYICIFGTENMIFVSISLFLCITTFPVAACSAGEVYTITKFGTLENSDIEHTIGPHGLSLHECVHECSLRSWCRLLGYARLYKICLAFPDDDPLVRERSRGNHALVFISRNDIISTVYIPLIRGKSYYYFVLY